MTFKQHIPAFVDTDTPPVTFEFQTAAELLAHPWVDQWTREARFLRYSVGEYTGDVALLSEEDDTGAHWCVLGYLRPGPDALALGLPRWKHPEIEPARAIAKNEIT
jgi:hypothetical protein